MGREETYVIGIDYANRDSLIGSLMVSIVVVKPDFFRKFSWLKVRNINNPVEINRVVELTGGKVVNFQVKKVPADQIHNLDNATINSMVESLNTQHKFWQHRIHIHNFLEDRDELIEKITSALPKNLQNKELHTDKWTIDTNPKSHILGLASIYARYHATIELNEIRAVWGNFGTGKKTDPATLQFIGTKPDCPHIRKEVLSGEKDESKKGEDIQAEPSGMVVQPSDGNKVD